MLFQLLKLPFLSKTKPRKKTPIPKKFWKGKITPFSSTGRFFAAAGDKAKKVTSRDLAEAMAKTFGKLVLSISTTLRKENRFLAYRVCIDKYVGCHHWRQRRGLISAALAVVGNQKFPKVFSKNGV